MVWRGNKSAIFYQQLIIGTLTESLLFIRRQGHLYIKITRYSNAINSDYIEIFSTPPFTGHAQHSSAGILCFGLRSIRGFHLHF